VRDLARRHQLRYGAGDVFDGHGRVDPVLVEQVHPVGAQSPQRRVGHTADLLGPAVQANGAAIPDVPAELGGDDDPVAHRFERLADEFLVDVGAIDLGGVEEGDAALDGTAQDTDHLVAVARVRAVALAHPHAAETESGHLQSLAERSGLHTSSPHQCRDLRTGASLKEIPLSRSPHLSADTSPRGDGDRVAALYVGRDASGG
jgi:hypothetical protein